MILAFPGTGAQFDRAILPEYLAFGYLSGEQTFYAGIRKLMPGHWMEVDASGQVRIERYWDLSRNAKRALTPGELLHPDLPGNAGASGEQSLDE